MDTGPSFREADAFRDFAEQQLPILRREYLYFVDAILFTVAIERWNNGNARTTRATIAESRSRPMEFQLLLLTEFLDHILQDDDIRGERLYNNIDYYIDKFNLFELKQNYQDQILRLAEGLGPVVRNDSYYNVPNLIRRLQANNAPNSNFKRSDITNYENYRRQYPRAGVRSGNYRSPIFTFDNSPRLVDIFSTTIDPSITIEMVQNHQEGAFMPRLQGFWRAYYANRRYPHLTLRDAVSRYNSEEEMEVVQLPIRANDEVPTTIVRTPTAPIRRVNIATNTRTARTVERGDYVTDVTKAIPQETIEKKIDGINYAYIINYYYKCTNTNPHAFNMDSIISYCAKSNTRDACKICPTCRAQMDLKLYKQPDIVSEVFSKIFDNFIVDAEEEEIVPERIEFIDKFIPLLKRRPEILNLFTEYNVDDDGRDALIEEYLVTLPNLGNITLRDGLDYLRDSV